MADQGDAIVTIAEYHDDRGCHVALRGRLDVRTVADLRLTLHRLIASGTTPVLLDLGEAHVGDATGFGLIVECLRRARHAGRPAAHRRGRRPHPTAAAAGPAAVAAARGAVAGRAASPRSRSRGDPSGARVAGVAAPARGCGHSHRAGRYPPPGAAASVRRMSESTDAPRPERDRPWVMRTYAGHSSAAASNALYRRNLDKGQTGLSVAFDLPTQTGYDPDHVLARGEVGKVGVPISHIGDMRALFADIPLSRMNTSMTINATAMWLLALYQVAAEEQAEAAGEDPASAVRALAGTTQNDIIKEYLSRGTYVFAPGPSLRLITDMVAYTVAEIPRWNPTNICSYHLQEAGATPVQEIAYAMCTAIAVLDAVRDSGQVPPERFGEVVARISFFVNAGVRFVEEMCKMRAFVQLWDELTLERYGVTDAKQRRFRYGVQVNSLGLTEAQPENNVQRIVLEMLAVTMSKDARARAVQLPAWNEALGLPAPVGPAVVAAHPAGARLRERPARVRRPLRGLDASSRPRSPSSSRARAPRSTGCRPWAARWPPSRAAT